jgi:MerR family glutamine synthetase transcriptional repressor
VDDGIRRNTPLFSMSIVGKLTGLSARQIRYYEEQGLIFPERTKGNRRLFSFNDVERLLEIKALLDKGMNLAGIKHVLSQKGLLDARRNEVERPDTNSQPLFSEDKPELTDEELLKLLKQELTMAGRHGRTTLIQGELSRFFH